MSLLFKRKQLFDKQTRSKVKIFFYVWHMLKISSFYTIIQ